MSGPALALAASARPWPDRLHRFLLDHGGGRVRSRVMSPDQAIADQYDVLFIDDICSFLTPRLIRRLRAQSKEVVGVFSPTDDQDAKRRLGECGISEVIEEDASPEEFVLASAILVDSPAEAHVSDHVGDGAFRIGVAGCPGSGVTEVAAGLAHELSGHRAVLLMDLDLERPSLAQRLHIAQLPSLRTAIDLAMNEPDRLLDSVQEVGALDVVAGIATTDRLLDSFPSDRIEPLIEDLGSKGYGYVVADLGELPAPVPVHDMDLLVCVGTADPVGLARLIKAATSVDNLSDSLLLVVNRTPRGRRHDEIQHELANNFPSVPVVTLPSDPSVNSAAWDGSLVPPKSKFGRKLGAVAELLTGWCAP